MIIGYEGYTIRLGIDKLNRHYMYMYIYTLYMYMYICIYMYMYMYTYIDAVYTPTWLCTHHIYMDVFLPAVHGHTQTHVQICLDLLFVV